MITSGIYLSTTIKCAEKTIFPCHVFQHGDWSLTFYQKLLDILNTSIQFLWMSTVGISLDILDVWVNCPFSKRFLTNSYRYGAWEHCCCLDFSSSISIMTNDVWKLRYNECTSIQDYCYFHRFGHHLGFGKIIFSLFSWLEVEAEAIPLTFFIFVIL